MAAAEASTDGSPPRRWEDSTHGLVHLRRLILLGEIRGRDLHGVVGLKLDKVP